MGRASIAAGSRVRGYSTRRRSPDMSRKTDAHDAVQRDLQAERAAALARATERLELEGKVASLPGGRYQRTAQG